MCGFHVVLPSETWCTVIVHLGTIAYNLHRCGRLHCSNFIYLTWPRSRELCLDVVLGLLDVVLDGLVSVRPHVSNICIPPLAFGGCISPCVTATFPSSRPGTASFTLLPFDATGKSSPRWRLALAQEAVRGKLTPRPFFFPCGILACQFLCFCCLRTTQLFIVDLE